MSDARIPCSVIVLTLNEERNVEACLESLRSFADVHVLDSASTDGTCAIAERLGANVATNPFAGFGQQRNWGHDHLPLKHKWVLHLDADERMTPLLAAEIERAINADDGRFAGYLIAERTLLRGRWLRRAAMYPRYQVRLAHRDRMRYVDHGHGQRESSSLPFGTFANPYDHLAFSHGTEHWLKKHAGYAAKEATQFAGRAPSDRPLRALFAGTPLERHRAIKRLAMRVPLRPLIRQFYVLFIRLGVLDGSVGWEYARMLKLYEQMIDLCIAETQDRPARGEKPRVAGAADARLGEIRK